MPSKFRFLLQYKKVFFVVLLLDCGLVFSDILSLDDARKSFTRFQEIVPKNLYNITDDDRTKNVTQMEIDMTQNIPRSRRDLEREIALGTISCGTIGFYKHPLDCTQYYHCFLSNEIYIGYLHKCPNGLVFDEKQSSCVWPWMSEPCKGSLEVFPSKRFLCSVPGFHVDPVNCRWFYYCSYLGSDRNRLEAFEFLCPSELLGFDEKRMLCNWKWTVPKCLNSSKEIAPLMNDAEWSLSKIKTPERKFKGKVTKIETRRYRLPLHMENKSEVNSILQLNRKLPYEESSYEKKNVNFETGGFVKEKLETQNSNSSTTTTPLYYNLKMEKNKTSQDRRAKLMQENPSHAIDETNITKTEETFYPLGVLLSIVQVNKIPPQILLEVDSILVNGQNIDLEKMLRKLNVSSQKEANGVMEIKIKENFTFSAMDINKASNISLELENMLRKLNVSGQNEVNGVSVMRTAENTTITMNETEKPSISVGLEKMLRKLNVSGQTESNIVKEIMKNVENTTSTMNITKEPNIPIDNNKISKTRLINDKIKKRTSIKEQLLRLRNSAQLKEHKKESRFPSGSFSNTPSNYSMEYLVYNSKVGVPERKNLTFYSRAATVPFNIQQNRSISKLGKMKKVRILIRKRLKEKSVHTEEKQKLINVAINSKYSTNGGNVQNGLHNQVWNVPFINELTPSLCIRAGLFQHPNDFKMFYECFWDKWLQKFTLHVFSCPIRLVYDESIRGCNLPIHESL